MEVKTISQPALAIIERYRDVPYFNSKTRNRIGGLRVHKGKGSPDEIKDEIEELMFKKKISQHEIKKYLVEHDIGIDCSAFVYHVLNAEKVDLASYINFPYSTGIAGKLRAIFRKIGNLDVKTFAHNSNSRIIDLKDVQPADIITMISQEISRNHILLISKVEYENSLPKNIYYVHSVAWPTDGEYGHGLHKGMIRIVDNEKPLVEQEWIELEKTGAENYTFARALISLTELRRLSCLEN